jgi:acetyl esterase/lipase
MRVSGSGLIARINLALAILLFAVSLLIYLPSPTYELWVLAAIVTEIPLPMALLGMATLGISQLLFIFGRHRLIALNSTVVAALAISLSLTVVQAIFDYSDKAKLKLNPIEACDFLNRMPSAHNPPQIADVQKGVEYTTAGERSMHLDIYQAAKEIALNKAVIVVHGGSWRGGKRSDFATCDYWLAGHGYTVFDIDYRLADGSVFYPAQVDDLISAVDWVKAHSKQYAVSPKHIALLGRSAGGQIVLDAAYRGDLQKKPLCSCVVSYYGPTDLAWNYANPVEPDVIHARSVLENYLLGSPSQSSKRYKRASPALNVSPTTPPTLLFHGLHDQLVAPQNTFMLEAALKKQNRTVETCILPWANHGFDWNFNGFSSQISRVRLLKFLNQYL